MRATTKRLVQAIVYSAATTSPASSSSHSVLPHAILMSRALNTRSCCQSRPFNYSFHSNSSRGVLDAPWSASQFRGAKSRGSDLRPGNVIERKGKVYQVVKAQHTTQGRGGAIIQVELRDVESGNKVNERLRTEETVEKVFVEAKSFTYLYTDEESDCVVLMDPKTYVQLDVPKHLFGDSLPYLKDDMIVKVELYNERPMSASVPKQVTCTVTEAQTPIKGIGATPHNKKVLLDNGLTVQVPPHILSGDKIIIDTTDSSYISRA